MNALQASRILLADDDPNFRKVVSFNLTRQGAEVLPAENGRQAWDLFRRERPDLVLSDIRMPELDGLALLREIHAVAPDLPVILITAHGDIDMAVEAMQAGAADFVTKPFDRERLLRKLERALRPVQLEKENRILREELTTRHSFDSIIGAGPAMTRLFEIMRRVLPRETTVLILGESGTGKELVARALHYNGPRRNGPFVAVNCAAIPVNLLESEMFGHTRGAFTGADTAREGRFQLASGGTLFLDEIGDMPPELQAKLLRVLQERQVEPVGSSTPVAVDVRLIAATHQDLEQLVRDGRFRQDLYYRLNVVPITVPALRDRREDIPLLVRHFLRRLGEDGLEVERDAMERLSRLNWPGNVRELENTIERALALRRHPDRITADDIQPYPGSAPAAANLYEVPDEGLVLDELEKALIQSALRKTGNNQTRAAALLGITRQKLIYRMQKHDLA
ncbi:MAG: Transcriptional regulatory protein ZraR [candidate division BRC1 bacterium ADurb.BinA292]|nr:MAG: Transcriptional regulatory protein ZraR [candidate division BRC1 bacterium ADurb.BinA292]